MLIVNPKSGGGKAQSHDLVGHCRTRGIEPLLLKDGDDISRVATDAVLQGADMLGTAGGDGSQAAVAAVAAEHNLPYVVVPSGTRNHFALDVGVDRNDVVGALDAFFHGRERRIDLAQVNGRVFVNNASMGLYGALVRSPEYRDAKLRTVVEMLPELLGPLAQPFDLRYGDPDDFRYVGAQLLLVSNNRYALDPLGMQGTRGGMDTGTLGVLVVRRAPPLQRMREWTTRVFRVDSGTRVDLGLDGEAVTLDPPLIFELLPSVLRIQTTLHGTPQSRGSDSPKSRPDSARLRRWRLIPVPGRSSGLRSASSHRRVCRVSTR